MRYILVSSLALMLAACGATHRDQDAAAGAVIGGAGGAIIGNQVGSPVGGAALGAGAGAIAGAAVGVSQDQAEANAANGSEVLQRQEKALDRQRKELEDIERQKRYDRRFEDEYSPRPLMQQNNSN